MEIRNGEGCEKEIYNEIFPHNDCMGSLFFENGIYLTLKSAKNA
jgi:hypothetical protein